MKNKLSKLAILFLFFFSFWSSVSAATIIAATGAAGNWTSGTAWVGGVAPTAADDASITNLTTSITIDAGAVARSADFTGGTGFTGTLTQGATGTLTLGDGTAGAGNVALKLNAGATYAPNSASTISFISTSATQQTVTTAGYTMGNMTFNSASNGNYAITDNTTLATASTLTLTKGTLHTDGTSDTAGLTHSWGLFSAPGSATISLNLGASNITVKSTGTAWAINNNGTVTLTAGTSTITITGASASFNTVSGLTYNNVTYNGGGSGYFLASGTTTLKNLTVTGTNVKTDSKSIGANFTITGTLTLTGNSAINRLFINSGNNNGATKGTQRTITFSGAAATTAITKTDFQDMKFATASGGPTLPIDLSAISGNSGDAGGNDLTTMTLTSSLQLYWRTAGGGTWSTAANWDTNPSATSRVPLPQDDASFSASAGGVNLNSGVTITMDMPRSGRSIDFTGMTNTGTKPIFTWSTVSTTNIYGSLTLLGTSSMTWTVGATLNLEGHSPNQPAGGWTLTSAGQTMSSAITFQPITGTYKLLDALSISGALNLLNGTFDANNFNVTATTFTSSGGIGTHTLTMGTGSWTVTGTGTVWNCTSSLTLTSTGSTILVSNTTATSKTFTGGTLSYNNVTWSGDNITVSDSNTFSGVFAVNNGGLANGLKLTAAKTQTIGSLTSNGAVGSVAIMISATPSSNTTLSDSAGTNCANYMTLTDIVGTGGATWNMGANSTFLRTTNLNATTCSTTNSNFLLFY